MPKPAPAQAGGTGGLRSRLTGLAVSGHAGPPPLYVRAGSGAVGFLVEPGCGRPVPPSFLRRLPHSCAPLRHSCPLSVIPAQAGIHAVCGVKGTPSVRRRPITRGALGALVGRRADRGSSHGWAVAWIPASAGMTEGAGVTEGGGRDQLLRSVPGVGEQLSLTLPAELPELPELGRLGPPRDRRPGRRCALQPRQRQTERRHRVRRRRRDRGRLESARRAWE